MKPGAQLKLHELAEVAYKMFLGTEVAITKSLQISIIELVEEQFGTPGKPNGNGSNCTPRDVRGDRALRVARPSASGLARVNDHGTLRSSPATPPVEPRTEQKIPSTSFDLKAYRRGAPQIYYDRLKMKMPRPFTTVQSRQETCTAIQT